MPSPRPADGTRAVIECAPAHGIAVLRFPIKDAPPPHDGLMPQFCELVGQILEAARAGRTVGL